MLETVGQSLSDLLVKCEDILEQYDSNIREYF